MNTARTAAGGAGVNSTSALVYGGSVSPKQQTELWNGTSWSEVADISTARSAGGSSGTATSALYSGGNTGSKVTTTEEWNDPVLTVKTVDVD